MEIFGEAQYQRAYQRGLAWAEEIFRGWRATGQPVPRELPLTKHDAEAVLGPVWLDLERSSRAASVLYATARVRWRRLVSLELEHSAR
jgi:hypothetical protein